MMRRCYIHIGTPKTGSTSLQAFLGENRTALRTAGLFLPESAGAGDLRYACHHAVVSELLGEPRSVTGGLDALQAELAASDAPDACISSENFSLLHDRPELLTRLRDAIIAAGFEPIIVVYLRPQVSYAIAIFALNVLNGYRSSFPEFLSEVLERGGYQWRHGYGPQFDYATLLDGFAAVFGRDAIIARRFSSDAPDASLLRSFVEIVLPGTPFGRFTFPPQRANRTLTFAGVLRLLGVRNALDEHVRFAPLSFVDLLCIYRRFAAPNRRLTERYGVRLPVCEPLDFVRALPIRKTPARSRQLRLARRLLNTSVSGPEAGVLSN